MVRRTVSGVCVEGEGEGEGDERNILINSISFLSSKIE
jgi:hypothetical protein